MEVTSSTGTFKRRKLASNDVRGHQFVSSCYDAVNSLENHSVSVPAVSGDSGRVSVESYAEGYETEISKLIKCRFSGGGVATVVAVVVVAAAMVAAAGWWRRRGGGGGGVVVGVPIVPWQRRW
ncbi:hypothetical protein RHMOL_Rhmol02G0279100 [Rhododendron molle]|uniref:Uncharacterized protein n=1 Tax=Rhododendron molle TaxID=49168 RepID=A0ACC0PUJ8_RHOML|nr:hypothetical protein RHMOL_Rhmol02G0279100 [Rhododendron molle]